MWRCSTRIHEANIMRTMQCMKRRQRRARHQQQLHCCNRTRLHANAVPALTAKRTCHHAHHSDVTAGSGFIEGGFPDSVLMAVHGLSRDLIAEGYTLTCQTFPVGPGVKVLLNQYDKVYWEQVRQLAVPGFVGTVTARAHCLHTGPCSSQR
jgi:hypothetical protein